MYCLFNDNPCGHYPSLYQISLGVTGRRYLGLLRDMAKKNDHLFTQESPCLYLEDYIPDPKANTGRIFSVNSVTSGGLKIFALKILT